MEIANTLRVFPQYLVQTFLLVWLLLITASLQAETSVWQVEKDGNWLYLGGTLHLLTASDFPLPEEFDRAFSEADTVFFETDIDGMKDPVFLAKSIKAMTYSDDRTLQSVITPETYSQLSGYFSSKGMQIERLSRFTAGGISLTATMLELQSLGYTSAGVDQYYHSRAKISGKNLGFFETPEEQLSFISELGEGLENEIVLYTLADIARLPELFSELKAAWRAGDVDSLYTAMIADLKAEFPDAYASLFLNRNLAWLPEIEAMLETEDVQFVLVGAGHMAGPDGLLQQLRDKGYTVTQL